jgi:hypothetical protein
VDETEEFRIGTLCGWYVEDAHGEGAAYAGEWELEKLIGRLWT